MLERVEIPAKAGAAAPYSCLPAGREGRVKALHFLTGFTSIREDGLNVSKRTMFILSRF